MKILVIGEVCLDKYIKCKIERLCPEAPVPVLNPVSESSTYGMAGNVIANLRSLSGNPELVCMSACPDYSIIKTRYVDVNSGYIIVRVDENDKITQKFDINTWHYEKFDAVVISDYCKGFLTTEDISTIASKCYEAKVPVFLDTKKMLGIWSTHVTFVKINEKEYNQQLVNSPSPELLCENLIVTFGPNGSKHINSDLHIPVNKIGVSDVSGAGDTYLAAFVLAYLAGKGRSDKDRITFAMGYANAAARIAVSKQGVVTVKKEEVHAKI